MPSVILTLEEVQALIVAKDRLEKVEKKYDILHKRYEALYGLYSQVLIKVADLERLI